MMLKKETSVVIDIQLTTQEVYQLNNYSKHIIDHIAIGELEQAIRQEQNTNNDIVIKYCCNYNNKVGSIVSNNCLILPLFNNEEIGYNYNNNIFSCCNVA